MSNLLDRVRTGNNRISKAWLKGVDSKKIDEALGRLYPLCDELMAGGYDKCLYPNNEKPDCFKPTICWVCPRRTK